MIDKNKKYKTRDGRDVRILCTNRKNQNYPVIALVLSNGDETCDSFTIEGKFNYGSGISEYDLIEVKEKKVRWLNVYDKFSALHNTREEADNNAGKYRIACIKVEFEEGEGLE